MKRFRIPERVAPSPAAEEPGLQNSAARLRSSREVQSRLLAERRGSDPSQLTDPLPEAVPAPDVASVRNEEKPGKGEGKEGHGGPGVLQPVHAALPSAKSRKEKLVVLFRLPLSTERLIADIPGAAEVAASYALRAFAKAGRAELRSLATADDLIPFVETARRISQLEGAAMAVGEPMTVYTQTTAIEAMHAALGDPWRIEPRARIVGAFLAAIVTSLIQARRVR
jgi:hypothetical protein